MRATHASKLGVICRPSPVTVEKTPTAARLVLPEVVQCHSISVVVRRRARGPHRLSGPRVCRVLPCRVSGAGEGHVCGRSSLCCFMRVVCGADSPAYRRHRVIASSAASCRWVGTRWVGERESGCMVWGFHPAAASCCWMPAGPQHDGGQQERRGGLLDAGPAAQGVSNRERGEGHGQHGTYTDAVVELRCTS
jgi:hypothetical protein